MKRMASLELTYSHGMVNVNRPSMEVVKTVHFLCCLELKLIKSVCPLKIGWWSLFPEESNYSGEEFRRLMFAYIIVYL